MLPSRPGLRPVSLFTDPSQANEDFPEFLNETPVTEKLVLLWEIRSLAGKDFKMCGQIFNFGMNLTSHRLFKMMLKNVSRKAVSPVNTGLYNRYAITGNTAHNLNRMPETAVYLELLTQDLRDDFLH